MYYTIHYAMKEHESTTNRKKKKCTNFSKLWKISEEVKSDWILKARLAFAKKEEIRGKAWGESSSLNG